MEYRYGINTCCFIVFYHKKSLFFVVGGFFCLLDVQGPLDCTDLSNVLLFIFQEMERYRQVAERRHHLQNDTDVI